MGSGCLCPRCAGLLAAVALALAVVPAFAESVLHRGNAGELQTLDQAHTSSNVEEMVLKDLYEGLTVYDPQGKIVPGAAQSWTISPDGLLYTFKLRPDARWSDGTPVTAGDFVFSFRRIEDPKERADYANILYPIKNAADVNKGALPADQLGVHALDEKTLAIDLEWPTPFFLDILAHQTALPVSKTSLDRNGLDFTRPGRMVSNGAFMLTEQVSNDHITVVKDPHYWDAANVKLDKVIFYPGGDQMAAVRRYEAGELDVDYDFSAEQIPRLKQEFGAEVHISPALAMTYYSFDTRIAPFSDVRVRRALSMAIDRDFLAQEIFDGAQRPLYGIVPPGLPLYGLPSQADFANRDQVDRDSKAVALMKEAGYGRGEKPLHIEIRYNSNPNHARVARAIADMWKTTLGVDVSFVSLEMTAHYNFLESGGRYNVARCGWFANYGDAETFLSLGMSGNKTFNYAHWSNAEFDRDMARSYTEQDPVARQNLLHHAESIMMAEQPVAPLMVTNNLWLVSSRVTGWYDNANNQHLDRFLALRE